MTRGQVELKGKSGDVYLVKFGLFSLRKLQQRLKMSLGKILRALSGEELDVEHFIGMMECVLVRPDPSQMTEEQLCDAIDDIGLRQFTKAFGEAIGDEAPADPLKPSGAVLESTQPVSA